MSDPVSTDGVESWITGKGPVRIQCTLRGVHADALRAVADSRDLISDAVVNIINLAMQQQKDLKAYARRQAALETALAESADAYRSMAKTYGALLDRTRLISENVAFTANSSSQIAGNVASDRRKVIETADTMLELYRRSFQLTDGQIKATNRFVDMVEFLNGLLDTALPMLERAEKLRKK